MKAKIEATWLIFGTAMMVAFTNAAINKITKMMGFFEKHKGMDTQEVLYPPRTTELVGIGIGISGRSKQGREGGY